MTKSILHCLLVSTTLRLLSISSKSISNSLRKSSSISPYSFFFFFAEYISPYSFTPLETHLCNPTSSPISANPSGSSLNQFNSINPAKTPDGYSFSHHFDRNFSSFSSKIGFCKVSSFGYWLNCANLRTCERNGSGVLRGQGFVSGLRSFSSESDRDPWSMMLLLLG